MKTWVLLTALAALAASATAQKKIVCYFGSWSVYRPEPGKFDIAYIDPKLCTHMIYTFVGITTEGDVRVLDAWQDLEDNYGKGGFKRFNKLRELNPSVKTLVAIGGWNEGSVKYSQVVSNPTTRSRFVKNAAAFVMKYGFDGFDLDWEYPNQRGGKPSDVENYVNLIREMRAEFDKHGLLLSAAVASAEPSASLSYDIPMLSKYLDFINVMAYDMHGAWEKVTGINAPLYAASRESGNNLKLNVNASINYWLSKGAAPEKLILGVPFYGRAFTLADRSKTEPGSPTTGPGTAGPYTRERGMLGYNEICDMLSKGGWTVKRDPEQRVPYAFKGDQWVGYDDVTSLTEKVNYINSLGLGGAMLWSIETDDFRGTCGEKYPLLKTLNHGLNGDVPMPTTKVPRPNPPVTHRPTSGPTGTTGRPTEATQPPTPSGVCNKEGYVRDKTDCSKFYFCKISNGGFEAVPFTCPNGLVFDTVISNCNYKHLVQC